MSSQDYNEQESSDEEETRYRIKALATSLIGVTFFIGYCSYSVDRGISRFFGEPNKKIIYTDSAKPKSAFKDLRNDGNSLTDLATRND